MPSAAKRNRQAQGPATPKHEPATPHQIEAGHDVKALIIDAVSELLAHGGDRKSVNYLVLAAMRHTRRRTLGFMDDDEDKETRDSIVDKFIGREFDAWKTDLAIGWRQAETAADPQRPEPKTVSELVKFNLRDRTFAAFDDFLASASPEEQAFVLDILQIRESYSLPADCLEHEVYIASAFEIGLGRENRRWVSIPEGIVDQVQRYIDASRVIEKADRRTVLIG